MPPLSQSHPPVNPVGFIVQLLVGFFVIFLSIVENDMTFE